MAHFTYDYIVVGAGSSGAVVAARLVEKGFHVLLLEAGGLDNHLWIKIPIGLAKLLNSEHTTWPYWTEPQAQLNGQKVYWPKGKVLGGSSSINGMVFVRGGRKFYDDWADQGCDGWAYEDVLPWFQKLETRQGGDPAFRGRRGPIHVTDLAHDDPLTSGFVAACQRAGIPHNPDYNGRDYEGVNKLQLSIRKGIRSSTAEGYLRPLLNNEKLALITKAHASRLLFEGRKCSGVEYFHGEKLCQAFAMREVIVSAGSIESPALLERSGIGDTRRLRALDIPVVCDSPGVGENLRDHLQVRIAYETSYRFTINDLMNSVLNRALAGAQYLFFRRGLLATPSVMAHAIARSCPESAYPDSKIQIGLVSGTDRYAFKREVGVDKFSGFTIGGFALFPQSEGSVHIQTADPFSPPCIEANYLTHQEDRRVTLACLRKIREIASQSPLKDFILRETRPGEDIETDEELMSYARECAQTSWHPIGTCRMGADGDSVVDTKLRVHGVQQLRVIDASIMPTMPSSNTNAPSIMIGEKGAYHVLASGDGD